MRFLALVLVLAATAAFAEPVKTDKGLVSGVVADGMESFKGIPFAKPPVGELRWRAPQPAAAWKGVKAADAFGKICMQTIGENMAGGREGTYGLTSCGCE